MKAMSDDDINLYVPSILNPRTIKIKDYNILLTQNSILTAKSLSLRKNRKETTPLRQEALKNVENILNNSEVISNKSATTECLNNNNTSIVNYTQSLASSLFNFSNDQTELNNNKTEVLQKVGTKKPEKCEKELRVIPKKIYYRSKDSVNGLLNELNDSVFDNSITSIIELVDITSDICEDESNDPIENKNKHHSSDFYNEDDNDIKRKKKKIDNSLYLNNDIIQTPRSKDKNQILNKNKLVNGSDNNLILKPLNQNGTIKKEIRIKFESNTSLEDFKSVDNNSDFSQHTLNYSVTNEDNKFDKECNKITDDMSKPLRVCKPNKCEQGFSKSTSCSPTSSRLAPAVNNSGDKDGSSKTRHELTCSAPATRRKSDSCSVHSQKKDGSLSKIPYYKIVAGTHFAVDAFSYGDIKNVKHYFLTHFHSDHYCGLKKSFDKTLFCSKITADLCMTRLGVNSKYIQVLQLDETLRIEGIEVTAVDANHCPGSIMLVFALPNNKTILHTGDFRASPLMESYPIFWNRSIYTVYLDTTYCHPRFKFPTQEDSIDMAVEILKKKKKAVESEGKKFSSVLIVCGTYTIGKEKFFLGLSRRIGCSIWAGTDKQRVLRACGNVSPGLEPAQCQLHVLPMRDITCHKLRDHLSSMDGVFSEVVAFKPSGWETNSNAPNTQRELVTIHGIPYSEHSSFSELIRFVKFLSPNQVVPTVDIAGGAAAIQKYFPCPVVLSENISQTRIPEYFTTKKKRESVPVT